MNFEEILLSLGWQDGSRMKSYGSDGSAVIVLHGGPAAFGEADPLAQALSDKFKTYAPWQRRSGDKPLTVAQHVDDLHCLISTRFKEARPILVGESWGAMLALAYAAEYPDTITAVVLVGCGTFDKASRQKMNEIIQHRTSDEMRARLSRLEEEVTDPEKQTMAWVEITKPIYHYSPIQSSARPCERFDLKGHDETWRDMIRCQEEDVYPQAFAAIKGPVIMLHGDYDPHPGRMTRDTLRQTIPHLEYREFEKCGHTPWMEKDAREDFLAVLSEWITRHALGR